MVLSEEVLTAIEDNARLFFTDKQIAIIVQIPYISFKAMAEDEDDPVHLALAKGRLMSEAEVRKSIFELATSGSSPAQQLALKYIQDHKIDNLDEE